MKTLGEHLSRELAWNLFLVARKYIPQERMLDFVAETTDMIRQAQQAIPDDTLDRHAAALKAMVTADIRTRLLKFDESATLGGDVPGLR